MTDDERAAIERAASKAYRFCEPDCRDSVIVEARCKGVANIITAELSPLLAAKDERIAELEGLLDEAFHEISPLDETMRPDIDKQEIRARITAALSPAAETTQDKEIERE